MPKITVNLETPVTTDSFRVQQVAGLFDLGVEERSKRTWHADLPNLAEDWQIGAIVGPSGAGKSVIARAYAQQIGIAPPVERYDWPRDKAVVDGFPDGVSIKAITGLLNSVGFSSPPAWVLPYHCLSNGQQFRADLARALLTPGSEDSSCVIFDEFTSVVDRQVARFGSAAVAKTIRKGRPEAAGGPSRFVAVTCHSDILDWLQPDWVLDLSNADTAASAMPARGSVQPGSDFRGRRRPGVDLDIRLAHRSSWPAFMHHHYLNHKLHRAARCYLAWWEGKPIAFLATLHSTGQTQHRAAHRLVVLPDFQGLGVGMALLEHVAAYEVKQMACVFGIVTSHPALIAGLKHRPKWRCRSMDTSCEGHAGLSRERGREWIDSTAGTFMRFRASFVYEGSGTR